MSTGWTGAARLYWLRMSHEGYHEPAELLPEETKDFHRAIESLIEELEAVDWYQQRADATKDESLRAVLLHNRNEEVEHAMMTLEWLRRRDAKIDETARTYLFTDRPITEIEEADQEEGGGSGEGGDKDKDEAKPAKPSGGSLGIGSVRSKR
jgi:ferritin-like protein